MRNNASHLGVENEANGKCREKKGQDPGMQGTEGGRFGPHPVPPSLKQRNKGTHT